MTPVNLTAAQPGQLLEHAAAMLDADVDPQRATEFAQRQIAVTALGRAHVLLAAAAGPGARIGTALCAGMAGRCVGTP